MTTNEMNTLGKMLDLWRKTVEDNIKLREQLDEQKNLIFESSKKLIEYRKLTT